MVVAEHPDPVRIRLMALSRSPGDLKETFMASTGWERGRSGRSPGIPQPLYILLRLHLHLHDFPDPREP